MQLSKSTQSSLSEINMVPFVDVVLVLLIIFMITAPILQSGIEIDVPKTKTIKDISQDRIVVSIDKGQHVYLGNGPVWDLCLRRRHAAHFRDQQYKYCD